MPMLTKRRCQSNGQRHVTKPPALWNSHVTFPIRPLNAQLPLLQVDVSPLKRHHLATPKACYAEQHDEVRRSIECLRGLNKTRLDEWVLDVGAMPPVAKPLVIAAGNQSSLRFSPDGRWSAYESDETGPSEVFVQALPDEGS